MKRLMMLIVFSLLILTANAQTFGEIGSGTTSTNQPVYSLWEYAWSSALYPASAFGGARVITQLAFNQIAVTTATISNQKIYLKETSLATFSSNNYENPTSNGYTLVYDGSISVIPGWVIIDIADFNYSGNNNLIIHWENRSGVANQTINWYSTECGAGVIKCLGGGTSFPTGTGWQAYPLALPNLRFYYNSDNPSTPSNPIPANSAQGIPITSALSFTLGTNTTGYQVWVGTSPTSLTQVTQQSITSPGTYTYSSVSQWFPNTQYYWKVVATNSSGSTSSPVWTFGVETVVNSLPVSQGFEMSFPIPGWLNQGNLWTQATDSHSGAFCAKASYIHTGTAILQTPRIVLPANPARLSFWWADADWIGERVVGHDTTFCEISNNNGQSWTTLATLSAQIHETAYSHVEISLADYTSQNIYIRFRDVTDGSFSAYGAFLDDFLIEVVPLDAFISINPSNLTYDQTVAGSTLTRTVTISNQGSTPLTITGVTPTGPFSATNPGTINAGQSAISTVSFSPESAGQATGTLTYNISGAFSGNNVLQCTGSAYAPYTELFQNFDASTALPENWSTILIAQSTTSFASVYTSLFDAHSGTRFIKMYNAGDDTLNAKLILVTPGLSQLSDHTLSFYAKSSWGLATDTVILGTMSNPADYNTFTPLQTITLTDTYQQFTQTFSPANSNKFIAFKHGLGGGENYAVYLDDISWESGSSTPNPAVAVYPVDALLNARINYTNRYLTQPLTWSSDGGNPTGYRLYFGATPSFELINNQDLAEVNSFDLNQALNYNTTYYWKIVPYNEQGNASDCPVWSFTTMADPTIQITSNNSLIEGFEQAEVGFTPLGWELENLNNDSVFWSTIANSLNSTNSHTGTKAMHMGFSFLTPHNDWLYTPPLQLQANITYKLEFWYKAIPFPGDPCVEKLEVKWGTMPSSIAMNTSLFFNDNLTNETYIRYEANLTPTLDGSYFVGFHAFSDPIQFILLIDDIKISVTNTSNEENITNPDIDNLVSCYPNPFNPQTNISYQLKNDKQVRIEIYNAKGQRVKTLLNGISTKGKHNLVWNGSDDYGKSVTSGIYFCKMNTGTYKSTIKMIKMN